MTTKILLLGLFAAFTGLAAFQLSNQESLFVDAPMSASDSAAVLADAAPNS